MKPFAGLLLSRRNRSYTKASSRRARLGRADYALLRFCEGRAAIIGNVISDTLILDDDQAQYVDALVRSGRYTDRREVVQAGLDALRNRDEPVERWLREGAVPWPLR